MLLFELPHSSISATLSLNRTMPANSRCDPPPAPRYCNNKESTIVTLSLLTVFAKYAPGHLALSRYRGNACTHLWLESRSSPQVTLCLLAAGQQSHPCARDSRHACTYPRLRFLGHTRLRRMPGAETALAPGLIAIHSPVKHRYLPLSLSLFTPTSAEQCASV